MKRYIKRNARVWKWIAAIATAIIAITVAIAIYLSYHWKPIVSAKIKESVLTSTDSLYTIDFKKLDINLLTGNIAIQNLVLKPDSQVYKKLQLKGNASKHLYELEINNLILNRVHPLYAYLNKKIKINTIILDKPVLKVWFNQVKNEADTVEKDVRTAYERISGFVKSVAVNDIVLQDIDFKYIDRSGKAVKTTALKNLNIKVTDLLIDSLSHQDSTCLFYTKDVFVQLKDYKEVTGNGMYTIRLKEFTASTADGYAALNGLKMIPRYPELEFSRKFNVQKDRYALQFEEIILKNINIKLLEEQGRLVASNLLVNKGSLSVFLNRERRPPAIVKAKKDPHMALKRLPISTRIDTVQIKNTTIRYTEYNPKSKRKGSIVFTGLSGTIRNVTNDSARLAKKSHAYANLNTKLMGKAPLNVQIDFNLTDPGGAFSYKGSLGAFDLRELNEMAKALGMVNIQSGTIRKADFNVKANSKGSSGNINLYYDDLRVDLVEKDENSRALEKKGLLSFLANAVLIKNDNPTGDEPLRKGPITFERPDSSSFFNVMWKSVFNGLKRLRDWVSYLQYRHLKNRSSKRNKPVKMNVKKGVKSGATESRIKKSSAKQYVTLIHYGKVKNRKKKYTKADSRGCPGFGYHYQRGCLVPEHTLETCT